MRKPRNEFFLKQKIRTFFLTHPLIIYKTTTGRILTHDATRVLICCIYDIDDMVFFDYDIKTNLIDSYLGKKMTRFEIFNALQFLEKAGLIENLQGDKDNYLFRMTHEGIHFFELRRKNFIYIAFNSILLPIIVSLLTTLVIKSF